MAETVVNEAAVNEEQPTFDFSRLTWGDTKKMTILQASIARATETGNIDAMTEAFDAIQQYLAKVVVSVPGAWVVPDAPDTLDWTDPDSYDWLRSDRFQTLMEAMGAAQQASRGN